MIAAKEVCWSAAVRLRLIILMLTKSIGSPSSVGYIGPDSLDFAGIYISNSAIQIIR